MRTKVHEIEGKGIITYRLPKIDEMSDILTKFKRLHSQGDECSMIKETLEFAKDVIVGVDINFEGNHISTLEELNDYPEFLSDLMSITDKVAALTFPNLEGITKKKR